jgi:hypothetical protein
MWAKAQDQLAKGRNAFVEEAVLLADLRRLHARHGHLSAEVIAQSDGYPLGVYRARFGSLTEAYIAAGLGQSVSECLSKLRAVRPVQSYRRKPDLESDEELLAKLRDLLRREGKLSNRIIDNAPTCRNAYVYVQRFGGMRRVYALVGYQPTRYQRLQMEPRRQAYSVEDADWVRSLVIAGASPATIRAADRLALEGRRLGPETS